MSTSQPTKGQSSLEFVTMIVIALLIFTAFVSFFEGKQTDAIQKERQRIAVAVADRIGFEIDLALTEGEGFSRTFRLRDTIAGEPYNVTLNGSSILLEYGDRGNVFTTTAADNVTGSIEPGENTVRNLGGVINVTQP